MAWRTPISEVIGRTRDYTAVHEITLQYMRLHCMHEMGGCGPTFDQI